MTKQVRQAITPTHVLGSTGTDEGDELGFRALATFAGDVGPLIDTTRAVISDADDTGSVTTSHRRTVVASTGSTASGDRSVVVASENSTASDLFSAVVASTGSEASGTRSVVVATSSGTASGFRSAVVASSASEATGDRSAVVASLSGTATGPRSAVVASDGSTASAFFSAVVASEECTASGGRSAVVASEECTASGGRSAVVASSDSTSSGGRSAVVASDNSTASASRSAVVASIDSETSGGSSAVVASSTSTASGPRSAVVASDASEASGTLRSAVVASRRTENDTTTSLALGDATSGDPSTANRTIHLFGANGNVSIAGTLTQNATFTDFAELMPNATGAEIAPGTLLTLDDGAVRPADEGEEICGAVSHTAAVLAGDTPFCWQGRYLHDEFGRRIYHDIPDEDWQAEIPDPDWQPTEDEQDPPMIANPEPQGTVTVLKESPEWNPDLPQVPRTDRPDEWTPVGLVGQVFVRTGEQVAAGDRIGSKGGLGVKSTERTGLKVMSVTKDYDGDYGIAKCLINVQV